MTFANSSSCGLTYNHDTGQMPQLAGGVRDDRSLLGTLFLKLMKYAGVERPFDPLKGTLKPSAANYHIVQSLPRSGTVVDAGRTLKADPSLQRTLFIGTLIINTHHSNFRGNPLHQTTRRHLTVKRWKMRSRTRTLICFWLSCVVFVPNAWKNVGMLLKAEIRTAELQAVLGDSAKPVC